VRPHRIGRQPLAPSVGRDGIMVIATRYKEKLPRHLSYPLGLEALATELRDVPQAEQLSVDFVAQASSATSAEHKRRSGEPYPVLTARFDHPRLGYSESNEMRERGLYNPSWSVVVYAVSRRQRAVARSLLREQGIPRVKRWLQTPRTATWLQGRKKITVYFSEADRTVFVEESPPNSGSSQGGLRPSACR
jgi:hypothetical protein